eukprot:PhF_6_TR13623/c1_g4_i1/m.21821
MVHNNKLTSIVVAEAPCVVDHSEFQMSPPTQQQEEESDNFFVYVRSTWRAAVRYLLPSYVYALVSLGPCMAVLLPQLYFCWIPYSVRFTGPIDDMTFQDRFQYCCFAFGLGGFCTCTFFIMLRNVLIWEQPVDNADALHRIGWITTTLSAVITIAAGTLNSWRFFGTNTSPWGDMVQLFTIPVIFWGVHVATRHNDGSKQRHSIMAAAVVSLDIAYGVLVSNLPQFYQSVYFTWTSPFIYSITALLSRKIAEVSTYPKSTAARVCTVSLGFNQIFVRGNHTVYLGNVGMMIGFEFFYSFVSIMTKVTIYYRHALIHKLTAGECKLVVKTTERGHCISKETNVVDSVFECGVFLCCCCLRQVVSPVSWGWWVSHSRLSWNSILL